MTFFSVIGRERQKSLVRIYRDRQYRLDVLPKIKIELLVDDEYVCEVIEIIRHSTFTGAIGVGRIYVTAVEEVIRIRTAEKGHEAS